MINRGQDNKMTKTKYSEQEKAVLRKYIAIELERPATSTAHALFKNFLESALEYDSYAENTAIFALIRKYNLFQD